jgi:Cu-Zn family superoxide dismutase
MHPRSGRALVGALTALLLTVPTAAAARDSDRHGRDRDSTLPTTYVLDPGGVADPVTFPEGVAARGDAFYVGSTTDGTVYRGDVDEPVATPFLLAGEDGRTSAVGMKVDGRTLFVAGGATGRVFAYDTRTGELTGSWIVADPATPADPTFLNDLVVTRRGDVYVTDSRRPVLYRIDARDRRTDDVEVLPIALRFAGTPVVYQPPPAFNLGGIAASPDGRTLVLAHSFDRALYRVSLRDGTVERIDLGGEAVGGDGLLLEGRDTLYAVERQGAVSTVVTVDLDRDLRSGTVVSRTPDASFDDATTTARVRRSLLVVNSQFGARNAGVPPTLPFTVSRVPIPAR